MTDIRSASDAGPSCIAPSALGSPGPVVFERCAEVAVSALRGAAGDGFRLASLSIDVASHVVGEGCVELTVRSDKRTSAIVFASVIAKANGRMVFSAQALFARG